LSEFTDENHAIESKRLLEEARKYMLDLSDVGNSEFDETHWDQGKWGHVFLSYQSTQKLRKLLYKAKLEHDKHVREKWTFRFGIAAGLVGLLLTAYQVVLLNPRLSDLSARTAAIEKRLFALHVP
jgi:hypothetical protein